MLELNDIDISNSEEIEEMYAQHKSEEIDLLAQQTLTEAENEAVFEKQRNQLELLQITEKQKLAKVQIQRSQRRQAKALAKAQRAAIRNREKVKIIC